MFQRLLSFLILVGSIGGRYWWAGRNYNGISEHTVSYGASKDLILIHRVRLKLMITAHSSGRMVSSGISDVVITTVNSEKTCLKKLMMMMMIMNKSQETTVFIGRQRLTSAIKLRPEK